LLKEIHFMQNSGCHGNQMKKLKWKSSSQIPLDIFQQYFAYIILTLPFTTYVKMIMISWKTWPLGVWANFPYMANIVSEWLTWCFDQNWIRLSRSLGYIAQKTCEHSSVHISTKSSWNLVRQIFLIMSL
jgi:hypothetical protein